MIRAQNAKSPTPTGNNGSRSRVNRVATAVTRARAVLKRHAIPDHPADIEKTIWGSPAGKKRRAHWLVALLPAHKTYVEPFAGSGAVLFAKEPAEVEVINDADPEIVDAYRMIKRLEPAGLARLGTMKWVGDEATFHRLVDTRPKDEIERLYRFLYLSHVSYGTLRGRSFSPSSAGVVSRAIRGVGGPKVPS